MASLQDEVLKVVREGLCRRMYDWSKVPKAFVMVRNELTVSDQISLQSS